MQFELTTEEKAQIDAKLNSEHVKDEMRFIIILNGYINQAEYMHAQLHIDDYERRGILAHDEAERHRRDVLALNMKHLDRQFASMDLIRLANRLAADALQIVVRRRGEP